MEAEDMLRQAMEANSGHISPQLARALQATENAWRRITAKYGMLTGAEVSDLLGEAPGGPPVKRQDLLSAVRGGVDLYPGFQFDRERGQILPVIAPLLELARVNGWSPADVTLGLCSPITSFDGEDQPVAHLHEPQRLLGVAKDTFEAEW